MMQEMRDEYESKQGGIASATFPFVETVTYTQVHSNHDSKAVYENSPISVSAKSHLAPDENHRNHNKSLDIISREPKEQKPLVAYHHDQRYNFHLYPMNDGKMNMTLSEYSVFLSTVASAPDRYAGKASSHLCNNTTNNAVAAYDDQRSPSPNPNMFVISFKPISSPSSEKVMKTEFIYLKKTPSQDDGKAASTELDQKELHNVEDTRGSQVLINDSSTAFCSTPPPMMDCYKGNMFPSPPKLRRVRILCEEQPQDYEDAINRMLFCDSIFLNE